MDAMFVHVEQSHEALVQDRVITVHKVLMDPVINKHGVRIALLENFLTGKVGIPVHLVQMDNMLQKGPLVVKLVLLEKDR